jgi:hypothetical protein
MTGLLAHFANSIAGGCENKFFGLNSWFHYLNVNRGTNNMCEVQFHFPTDVPLVILAVIDDLLRIAGVIAVFYVIYGGIRYIISQGSPDEVSKAQTTILSALVGLVIALISVTVVGYVGSHFGG